MLGLYNGVASMRVIAYNGLDITMNTFLLLLECLSFEKEVSNPRRANRGALFIVVFVAICCLSVVGNRNSDKSYAPELMCDIEDSSGICLTHYMKGGCYEAPVSDDEYLNSLTAEEYYNAVR